MTPSFPRVIQPTVLGKRPPPRRVTPTGLSPSMAGRSRPLRLPRRGGMWPPPRQPHIPVQSPERVRFELCPFPSPVLRASQLVSLPPPTEMLQFGGFPLPAGSARGSPLAGGPIRGSPDPSLLAAPRGLWQLATPFVGARAEPSTRRRSSEHGRTRRSFARRLCGALTGHSRGLAPRPRRCRLRGVISRL